MKIGQKVKSEYESPEVKIIRFSKKDVLTVSGDDGWSPWY